MEDLSTPDNWQLLPAGAHAVIDACDQIKAKPAMAVHARKRRTRFISVGAAGGKRMAHKVDVDDESDTA
jgi:tRNA A37 threonylcarbamoyladenosine dehydratase